MKKLSAILAAALLAITMGVMAYAAETATVSMETVETKVGTETVTLTVSTDRVFTAKALYIGEFSYDDSLVELQSGQWLLSGAALADFDPAGKNGDGIGVLAFDSNQIVSGEIFELTFKVKGDYRTSLPIYFSFEALVRSAQNGQEIPLEDLNVAPGLISFTEDPVYLGMEQKTVNASEGTVSVDLWVAQPASFKTIEFRPKDDIPGLELIGGEWLIDGEGASRTDWSASTPTASFSFASNTEVVGHVFRLTYKILDDAEGNIDIAPASFRILKYSETLGEEYGMMHELGWGRVTVTRVLRGDVDGSTVLDSDDAIYLLRYTLNPARYPINQSGDMDGNGTEDSDDAIYLLRHTLNPSRYPLAR